jgi:pimeloyl-ACP methyl ester carboxylesterase
MTPLLRMVTTPVGSLAVHETGAGPAVVFWHSMFVDHRMFARQLAVFSETRRCIAIDGPGYGPSGGPPRGGTLDDCARATIAVMDALGVERADFVGCGWGGHVGVCLASSPGGRLRSLTATNSPMQPLGRAERRRVIALSYLYRVLGPRVFLSDAVEAGLLSKEHRAELGPYVRECFSTTRRQGLYDAMRCFIIGRPSIEDRLGAIGIPTLLIGGAEDAVWPPALAREQSRRVPKARLEIIDGTAHLTPLEAPGAVNDLLRDFWTHA